MRSVLHIRQQARPRLLRLRRNFKTYQSVPTRTRGGFEKVGGRASVGSVQGGVEQPEEERQQPASPCFERPRQDYHQSGCRVNKLCCACHVFVLCFLSQSSVGLCKTTLPLGKKDLTRGRRKILLPLVKSATEKASPLLDVLTIGIRRHIIIIICFTAFCQHAVDFC